MNSHPRKSPPAPRPLLASAARSAAMTALLALGASQAACVVHPRTVYVVEQPPPPPQTVYVEAGADNTVVVDDFYEPLGNYGVWVYTPAYGRVWQPAPDMAGEGFVPYGSHGRWVVNGDGDWVFVSRYDTQWGWATYHYGRWAWTDYYGWVWVPGTAWAPSWVEWRYGGGYVGWVPMGPPGYVVVEEHWVFVQEGHVGEAGVIDHRLPPERARGAYVAANPIIEVKGSSKWKAGPPSHTLINSGVQITTNAEAVAPPAGWVRTQARVVNEKAADRRASGALMTAPQVRPGATVPAGAGVVQLSQPPARPSGMPGAQGGAQGQGRPDGSMQGQPMPQPAPQPMPQPTPGQMGPRPGPQPMPSQPSEPSYTPRPSPQPQPMPQPMPQPQPRPTAAPQPRPSPPPTAAPRPAPRPATPPPRPAPPKKRR